MTGNKVKNDVNETLCAFLEKYKTPIMSSWGPDAYLVIGPDSASDNNQTLRVIQTGMDKAELERTFNGQDIIITRLRDHYHVSEEESQERNKPKLPYYPEKRLRAIRSV